jgi:hypothetical protein
MIDFGKRGLRRAAAGDRPSVWFADNRESAVMANLEASIS